MTMTMVTKILDIKLEDIRDFSRLYGFLYDRDLIRSLDIFRISYDPLANRGRSSADFLYETTTQPAPGVVLKFWTSVQTRHTYVWAHPEGYGPGIWYRLFMDTNYQRLMITHPLLIRELAPFGVEITLPMGIYVQNRGQVCVDWDNYELNEMVRTGIPTLSEIGSMIKKTTDRLSSDVPTQWISTPHVLISDLGYISSGCDM